MSAATRTDAHQFASCEVRSSFVSELCHIPPETLGQHHHLRGHAEADRCFGKSLIGVCWWVSVCVSTRERFNFQSRSFNHSDISPHLESTVCERFDRDYRTRRRPRRVFLDRQSIQQLVRLPRPGHPWRTSLAVGATRGLERARQRAVRSHGGTRGIDQSWRELLFAGESSGDAICRASDGVRA